VPQTERFREIRGVESRRPGERRQWFQSPWFDLFVTRDREGLVLWFQLCYARDTTRERVLEWRRRRGFQHLKLRGGGAPTRKDHDELVLDGAMPFDEVMERFALAASGLPGDLAAFVGDKVREFARPARKWPFRRGTPRWLARMREQARLAFLDSPEGGR
jgi:hypothetical protein